MKFRFQIRLSTLVVLSFVAAGVMAFAVPAAIIQVRDHWAYPLIYLLWGFVALVIAFVYWEIPIRIHERRRKSPANRPSERGAWTTRRFWNRAAIVMIILWLAILVPANLVATQRRSVDFGVVYMVT